MSPLYVQILNEPEKTCQGQNYSLFQSTVSDEEKSFMTLTPPGTNVI